MIGCGPAVMLGVVGGGGFGCVANEVAIGGVGLGFGAGAFASSTAFGGGARIS